MCRLKIKVFNLLYAWLAVPIKILYTDLIWDTIPQQYSLSVQQQLSPSKYIHARRARITVLPSPLSLSWNSKRREIESRRDSCYLSPFSSLFFLLFLSCTLRVYVLRSRRPLPFSSVSHLTFQSEDRSSTEKRNSQALVKRGSRGLHSQRVIWLRNEPARN